MRVCACRALISCGALQFGEHSKAGLAVLNDVQREVDALGGTAAYNAASDLERHAFARCLSPLRVFLSSMWDDFFTMYVSLSLGSSCFCV